MQVKMNPSTTSAVDVEKAEKPHQAGDTDHQPASQLPEINTRLPFINKVNVILLVLLAVAVGFMALSLFEPHVKEFVKQHRELFLILFGVVVPSVVLVFFIKALVTVARRIWPSWKCGTLFS